MSQSEYNVTLIGGGIVGLATAYLLTHRFPSLRIAVLEKEPQLAAHQTGHNSGVIHSGIYYQPGSLKAALCTQGREALVKFCQSHGIQVHFCGKVIVATHPSELPGLEELYRRGIANQIPGISLIGPERLSELEPHSSGVRALHVPRAGIVDFTRVAHALAREIQKHGGKILLSTRVMGIHQRQQHLVLETSQGKVLSQFLICCGGLHADRLAGLSHTPISLSILPFRGEYFELIPGKRSWINGLIYPVPNPQLPFLGVHISRRIDGRVEAGPNAVLAFKREGYRKTNFSGIDTLQMLTFPGFWRMAFRYWRTGLEEWGRCLSKQVFIQSVQRLVPGLQENDLIPAGSGVRAQALQRNGLLLNDFHWAAVGRILHVLNAPSPAATACLGIGEYIVQTATTHFELERVN